MLASTSAKGDVAVFRVTEPEAPAPGSSPAYAPAINLKGGHKDVSRHVHIRHVPLLRMTKQPALLTQHFAIGLRPQLYQFLGGHSAGASNSLDGL